jgi:hypothetical protein
LSKNFCDHLVLEPGDALRVLWREATGVEDAGVKVALHVRQRSLEKESNSARIPLFRGNIPRFSAPDRTRRQLGVETSQPRLPPVWFADCLMARGSRQTINSFCASIENDRGFALVFQPQPELSDLS